MYTKEKNGSKYYLCIKCEVEDIMKYLLVGFNCRRYDNHMLFARMMGYSNEQLFNLSQKIIAAENKNLEEIKNEYSDSDC